MTVLWVDRYRVECGNCESRVPDWIDADVCDNCGEKFQKIGTHFIKESSLIQMIIQNRRDLEWVGVHPEKWND